MKLIFAQGNPGAEYALTRHNIGFRSLQSFADARSASFTAKPKFLAHVADLTIDGEKILLALPTTFYNETGQSARAIADFYKLDPSTDILVLHDDLALPFGSVRTRARGSDAGNNGIKSLNAHLGEAYHRVRIGIDTTALHRAPDRDFVLSRFSSEEDAALPDVFKKVTDHIDDFIHDSFSLTTN